MNFHYFSSRQCSCFDYLAFFDSHFLIGFGDRFQRPPLTLLEWGDLVKFTGDDVDELISESVMIAGVVNCEDRCSFNSNSSETIFQMFLYVEMTTQLAGHFTVKLAWTRLVRDANSVIHADVE